MACGFYRYGHDLHPTHLDFTRPASLFNHPKPPRSISQAGQARERHRGHCRHCTFAWLAWGTLS